MMLEREIKEDKRLSMALCGMYVSLYIANYTGVMSTKVTSSLLLWLSSFSKFVPIILVISCAVIIARRINGTLCFTVLSLLLIYELNSVVVVNSFTNEYFKYFITICLPCMILMSQIKMYTYFIQYMRISAVIVTFAGCLLTIIISENNGLSNSYYMGFSNISAFFCLFLIDWAFEKRKIKCIILILLSLFVILMLGSRGAIISIVFFFIIKALISNRLSLVRKIVIVIIVASVVIFYKQIFEWIYNIGTHFGIYSRTLFVMENDLSHMSGRDNIYAEVWREICKNPFKIRGIAFDRGFFGTYPHNIALELMYQFGIVFGGTAVIAIIIAVVRQLGKISRIDDADSTVGILLVAAGVMSLIFSNTLWKSMYFWTWLGYTISEINHSRKAIS